jgi:hypothetical protein
MLIYILGCKGLVIDSVLHLVRLLTRSLPLSFGTPKAASLSCSARIVSQQVYSALWQQTLICNSFHQSVFGGKIDYWCGALSSLTKSGFV